MCIDFDKKRKEKWVELQFGRDFFSQTHLVTLARSGKRLNAF
jgi:hypothetical protein